MNRLAAEAAKKGCVLVLEISAPADTLQMLAEFFRQRAVVVENLQLHRNADGTAQVIVHCQVEKDRIPRTVLLLTELVGVKTVEVMK